MEYGARWIVFHEGTVCDCAPRLIDFAEPVPRGPFTQTMMGLVRELSCFISFGERACAIREVQPRGTRGNPHPGSRGYSASRCNLRRSTGNRRASCRRPYLSTPQTLRSRATSKRVACLFFSWVRSSRVGRGRFLIAVLRLPGTPVARERSALTTIAGCPHHQPSRWAIGAKRGRPSSCSLPCGVQSKPSMSPDRVFTRPGPQFTPSETIEVLYKNVVAAHPLTSGWLADQIHSGNPTISERSSAIPSSDNCR